MCRSTVSQVDDVQQPARARTGGGETQPLGPWPGAAAAAGETQRMGEQLPSQAGEQKHGEQRRKPGGCRGWGFSWWMLWLIWPAIGMIKWLGAASAAALGEAAAQVNGVVLPFAAFWPLLLVAAFILLHRRLIKR